MGDFDFSKLLEGNNVFLLIIAYFLFKDKIDAFFKKVPAPVPVVPGPVVVPVPTPDERPIIDAVLKILPMILPLLMQEAVKAHDSAQQANKPDGK